MAGFTTNLHGTPSEQSTQRKKRKTVQEYYDSIASEFEKADHYWSNPYDSATWEMENHLVVKYLNGSDPILDLGVGFYPHVESTANKHLVNADVSFQSLSVARTSYGAINPSMVYVCGDALALPFREGAFPGIIAGGELLNHVPLEPALGEIHRVLQPGGRAVLSVAMKWCFDSLYAVLDSLLGNRIGYSVTRNESLAFLRTPRRSSEVTWEVTPDFSLRVTLFSRNHLLKALCRTDFRVVAVRSLNVASGLVPLPLQQQDDAGSALIRASRILLRLDRALFSRIPGLKWFAGNVFLIVEKQKH